jgi:hypothetical protein
MGGKGGMSPFGGAAGVGGAGSGGRGGAGAGGAGAGGKGGAGAGGAGAGGAGAGGKGGTGGMSGAGGGGTCTPPSGNTCMTASEHSPACTYVADDYVTAVCAVSTAGCCPGRRMLFRCVQMCDTQTPGDASYTSNMKWTIAGQCQGC